MVILYVLFLPEGQTGEDWNLPLRNSLSETGKRWMEERTVCLKGLMMQASTGTKTLT